MAYLFLLVLTLACGVARPGELRALVDTGMQMPAARIEHGAVVEGQQRDVGMAIADALGLKLRFVVLPRKRIVHAMETGQADLLCLYLPSWLPGQFDWSRPFYPAAEVVVTDRRADRPMKLEDLSGQRIGTVLGYRYVALEQALGPHFAREDAASAELNFRKMAVGRLKHVATMEGYVRYHKRTGDIPLNIHPPLVVNAITFQCAVSRHGNVSVQEVDKAIEQITHDGTLQKIVDYHRRP